MTPKDVKALERLNGYARPKNPNDEDVVVWDRLYSYYLSRLPTNAAVMIVPPDACITRVYQMYKK